RRGRPRAAGPFSTIGLSHFRLRLDDAAPAPIYTPGKRMARRASKPAVGIAAAAILLCFVTAAPAAGQKQGGILREYQIDSPASMSIHEEATVLAERTVMPVFSNLVLFDQHIAQNSLKTIRPELATDWAWDEGGTNLTFHLRKGVKWHDGKRFTAADVKCTFDLLQGKGAEKLRV